MNTVREGCWYDLIDKGSSSSGLQMQTSRDAGRHGKALHAAGGCRSPRRGCGSAGAAAPIALPPWLRTPAPPETLADDALRPSDPVDDEAARLRRRDRAVARARLARGTLVHRLLQSLPDIAAERRRDAALKYLARNAEDWTEDERKGAGRQGAGPDRGSALRARCSRPAAAPRSRSSAGWSGRAAAGAGFRANRPAGGDADEVLIVDYKTNHAPPRRPAEAPAGYVRQLALYRAVLAKLYPQPAGTRGVAVDRNS